MILAFLGHASAAARLGCRLDGGGPGSCACAARLVTIRPPAPPSAIQPALFFARPFLDPIYVV